MSYGCEILKHSPGSKRHYFKEFGQTSFFFCLFFSKYTPVSECVVSDCRRDHSVCVVAWSVWQGGACQRTSVSELKDLWEIKSETEAGSREGAGACNNVMTDLEREPSVLCHDCKGWSALHPLLSISPFPCFSLSQIPPPIVSLAFALLRSCNWTSFSRQKTS